MRRVWPPLAPARRRRRRVGARRARRDVPDYLFPAPSAVAASLARRRRPARRRDARDRSRDAARVPPGGGGRARACGRALHFSAVLRRALLPILVLSQTVPTVVLAPILAILLGYGTGAEARRRRDRLLLPDRRQRRGRAALDRPGADPHDADAARRTRSRSSAASSCPGALPAIFSGARIAATYAAVGAVFGEWAGSSAGLGFVMLQAQPCARHRAHLRGRRDPARCSPSPSTRSSRSPSVCSSPGSCEAVTCVEAALAARRARSRRGRPADGARPADST